MTGNEHNTLTGLLVSRAMRRHFVRALKETSIGDAIVIFTKHKINGLLATNEDGSPAGVLSKADIMGAYYAGLPLESPLEDIMARPPIFCNSTDSLEVVLERMRENGVYRIYVAEQYEKGSLTVIGSVAYPDIVGLLYKFCYYCEYSHYRQGKKSGGTGAVAVRRKLVRDVMTRGAQGVTVDDSIQSVMELLSGYRFGAILVKALDGTPVGVISKTDLALAYKHNIDPSEKAQSIMSKPVHLCLAEDLLEDALRQMIFADVHRLFVKSQQGDIEGVFSLTDAARSRSGSCHACISSRIRLETL